MKRFANYNDNYSIGSTLYNTMDFQRVPLYGTNNVFNFPPHLKRLQIKVIILECHNNMYRKLNLYEAFLNGRAYHIENYGK